MKFILFWFSKMCLYHAYMGIRRTWFQVLHVEIGHLCFDFFWIKLFDYLKITLYFHFIINLFQWLISSFIKYLNQPYYHKDSLMHGPSKYDVIEKLLIAPTVDELLWALSNRCPKVYETTIQWQSNQRIYTWYHYVLNKRQVSV